MPVLHSGPCLCKVTGVPGVGHIPAEEGDKIVEIREHPIQIPAVVAVHVVDVVVGFQILPGDLGGTMAVTADAVTVQFPAGGGIDGIAQFFPGGCPGINLEFMGNTGLGSHIL